MPRLLMFFLLFQVHNLKSQDSFNIKPNCNPYFQFNWLPDAYIANAFCVCENLNYGSKADTIRLYLINRLTLVDTAFMSTAKQFKDSFINHKLPKRKYHKFVVKKIVPMIKNHHKEAFEFAGCHSKPAPTWIWKVACKREFNDCEKMFKKGLYFGAGCTGKWGQW